jgi:hypothetical protein
LIASVAGNLITVVACFLIRLQNAITTTRTEYTTDSAFAISTVVHAIVTRFAEEAIDFPIATKRAFFASWSASTIRRQIRAIVAFFAVR